MPSSANQIKHSYTNRRSSSNQRLKRAAFKTHIVALQRENTELKQQLQVAKDKESEAAPVHKETELELDESILLLSDTQLVKHQEEVDALLERLEDLQEVLSQTEATLLAANKKLEQENKVLQHLP
jgi:hypothetical protein